MAKTYPGKQWGNDKSNSADVPDWDYLTLDTGLTGGVTANLNASSSGWTSQMPGAEGVGEGEILVAIGGLSMPLVTVLSIQPFGVVGHTNSESLAVTMQLSSGVVVESNSANVYIVAIGDDANTGNANLIYIPSESQPESGVLVFELDGVDLSTIDDNSSLTINSTSVFHGNIISRKKKGPAQAINSTSWVGNTVFTIVYP